MKLSITNTLKRTVVCSTLLLANSFHQETQASTQATLVTNWLAVTEGNIKTKFSANDDYSDLKKFGEAIGDKRFVLLDEATHGDGNVFALKSRLVKYLHEKKGFDVFLLESALFDVSRIWKDNTQPITSQAPGNIFYMYANSAEVQPLFNYIDTQRETKRPLYFAGFDNRHSGRLSNAMLVSSLEAYLASTGSKLIFDSRWPAFRSALSNLVGGKAKQTNELQQQAFVEIVSEITSFIANKAAIDLNNNFNSSSFWHRVVKSVARMADVAWRGFSIADHDAEMAQNIEWLMNNVYPDKKAIIWGQYVHLSRNGNPDHTDGAPDPNVGTELERLWPNQIYSVHFGGGKGSYTNFITLEETKIESPAKNSLEAALTKLGISTAFIDQSNLNLNAVKSGEITMLTYHYDETERVLVKDWSKHWDGMFVLNPIQPVEYLHR